MDTFGQFRPIRDHIFKTVSPKLYFLFSVLGYILSRKRCKLRRKFSKTYSPCVFFKDKLRLYIFESLKWKTTKNYKTNLNWSCKYLTRTPVGNTAMKVNRTYWLLEIWIHYWSVHFMANGVNRAGLCFSIAVWPNGKPKCCPSMLLSHLW